MATIYTLGHSTRTTEELCTLVEPVGITVIADVRRFPGSKRHPHLAREELERSLPAAGIGYEWWGEGLGGRRATVPGSRHIAWRNASFQGYADHMDTSGFRDALEKLEDRAAHERIAVMCAEAVWWRCHRRLISDAVVLHGHSVVHLLGAGRNDSHKLHPNVRADPEGWPVYDVNVDLPLDLP